MGPILSGFHGMRKRSVVGVEYVDDPDASPSVPQVSGLCTIDEKHVYSFSSENQAAAYSNDAGRLRFSRNYRSKCWLCLMALRPL